MSDKISSLTEWHYNGNYVPSNSKGPIIAMNFLDDATSSWTNIENFNESIDDENGRYTDFKITGKARLPYLSEIDNLFSDFFWSYYNTGYYVPFWTFATCSYMDAEGNGAIGFYERVGCYATTEALDVLPVISVSKSQIES